MQSFFDALRDGGWEVTGDGVIRKELNGMEICLEPLLTPGQFYLAFYDRDQCLLTNKIPMKFGK